MLLAIDIDTVVFPGKLYVFVLPQTRARGSFSPYLLLQTGRIQPSDYVFVEREKTEIWSKSPETMRA